MTRRSTRKCQNTNQNKIISMSNRAIWSLFSVFPLHYFGLCKIKLGTDPHWVLIYVPTEWHTLPHKLGVTYQQVQRPGHKLTLINVIHRMGQVTLCLGYRTMYYLHSRPRFNLQQYIGIEFSLHALNRSTTLIERKTRKLKQASNRDGLRSYGVLRIRIYSVRRSWLNLFHVG